MAKTTRANIIQAALSSFATHGYEGTTLAHIAASVGLQKPSLYNHFSSKDALFLTVAEQVMDEFIHVMTTSANEHQAKTTEARMYAMLTDSTAFIFRHHEGMMYKRLLIFPPAALEDELRTLGQSGDETIDQLLRHVYEQGVTERALQSGSFAMFRAGFYCLMDGLFTERFIYREDEFWERLEGAWAVFWRGVST